MADLNLAYEVKESAETWIFRFPADDETALWQGPFPDRAAVSAAAKKFIESYLAHHAAEVLGLK
ncbi:hypothetical protein B9J07_28050 [Sinorhizobium sp. LM21]|uniref:hypothetical protein n=1 Tax=Sinorhizobium sp. LM21 TaxID=1449788 RepID=UPI0005D92DA9|nr:hypothetical protein [Sinorhizobium sp. LM21]AJW30155.1 hypothetical protein pLM21S1_p34 [Sinorhizobium sp. LM21]OWZ90441.1 hypothetical protein B9J07_28050 [Sinorhizobium sp. LM21]